MPATENRVIVLWASPEYGDKLKRGTIVTHIDGRKARALLDQHGRDVWSSDNPYCVSSPQRARFLAYRLPFLGKKGQLHTLRIRTNGKTELVPAVSHFKACGWPHTYNRPSNLTGIGQGLSCGILPSGAGYMYMGLVNRETHRSIRRALHRHLTAKGWIIDLRGNGGGGYDRRLIAQIKRIPRLVAVLIDSGCMSAGETLARDLARHTRAVLMGSSTAGASRETATWQFPSGLATLTCSIRSHWRTDGEPIEYNGIQPDVELEPVPDEVVLGLNSEILRAEEYLTKAQSHTLLSANFLSRNNCGQSNYRGPTKIPLAGSGVDNGGMG